MLAVSPRIPFETCLFHKAAGALILCAILVGGHKAQASNLRRFTIQDEVGLADFGDNSYTGKVEAITWSPDHQLVAVHVGRGLLASNRVQSELRIYSRSAISAYLAADKRGGSAIKPVWTIKLSTYKEGPIIQKIKWSRSSTALAFLQRTARGNLRLMYADVNSHAITPLSYSEQDVVSYDVVDRQSYVYAVREIIPHLAMGSRSDAATEMTGRPLLEILFPAALYPENAKYIDRSTLWIGRNGRAAVLKDQSSGKPFVLFSEGLRALSLSPDGKWIVTVEPIHDVPATWASEYLPPSTDSVFRVQTGRQDTAGESGALLTSHYVMISIRSGRKIVPLEGPTGSAAGWWSVSSPAWSKKGDMVLLPSAFIGPPSGQTTASSACIIAYDVTTATAECVMPLRQDDVLLGGRSKTIVVAGMEFADNVGKTVKILTANGSTIYRAKPDQNTGAPWTFINRTVDNEKQVADLQVRQSFDSPPVLIARDAASHSEKTVWDPNPQLRDLEIANVSIMRWKDAAGRDWTGALYKPPHFELGKKYPLVIQTHNFVENVFRPSGAYPTGYAAQALAAKGFVVLEARCNALINSAIEGTCQAPGFEAAVHLLAENGTIDPQRLGIIGFSRTCYNVLEVLTKSGLHFEAAIITDGFNAGYWQYLTQVDADQNIVAREAIALNGAEPVGTGLMDWIWNAPTFNLDKIHTPVWIIGEGTISLMSMWEPYASLRYQGKPVDLTLLNTTEHVLTTPWVRMASQGGTVDWMQFWLRAQEDAAPKKASMYRRWEGLCDIQIANKTGYPTFCVPTRH